MKKVVMYDIHSNTPLFMGTETECRQWVLSQADEHIRLADGKLIVRELYAPDGIIYDVGRAVMYQIVDADGNEVPSIYSSK